jgi:hypothetical protein
MPALSSAAELTAREPELHKRVTALLRKLAPAEPRSIEMPPEDPLLELELHPSPKVETAGAPPPRIVPIRVVGMDDAGLRVSSATGTHPLPFERILGLGLALVPATDGRNTVITDLVLSWPEGETGPTVLRASLGDLGLDRLSPGIPPKEAYWRWVREVETRSGAIRLPRGAGGETLARYAGPEEMTRALYR